MEEPRFQPDWYPFFRFPVRKFNRITFRSPEFPHVPYGREHFSPRKIPRNFNRSPRAQFNNFTLERGPLLTCRYISVSCLMRKRSDIHFGREVTTRRQKQPLSVIEIAKILKETKKISKFTANVEEILKQFYHSCEVIIEKVLLRYWLVISSTCRQTGYLFDHGIHALLIVIRNRM